VLDLELVPRFLLFLPLPALVILGYGLETGMSRRPGRVLVGLAAVGTAALLFGEVMSLLHRDPHKAEIHRELLNLKQRLDLSRDDLVLTRYGVPPICNWFLGTRSSLITAFNRRDIEGYDRVFVLNPLEGSLVAGSSGRAALPHTVSGRKDAYRMMRRNVPLPAHVQPAVRTEHLTLYELRTLPDDWRFNGDGTWVGFGGE